MDWNDTLLAPDRRDPGKTRRDSDGTDAGFRAAPPAAPSAPGSTVLDRYRLLEQLGEGGFGVVWRAHDERLRREVAVKRITLVPDGDHGERAAREAEAAARLSHPAIVALYEAQNEGSDFYLVSELVHGDTLAALIVEGSLTDEEVLEIGLALSDALEHAHVRGVIHRDVKPHNVLIPHDPEGARGIAKLTDFGGAHLVGEDALTRTGDVLGTLAYMAPEQAEGRPAGEQADLYSLALLIYEALSGVNPVRGPNPAATARRLGQELPALELHRRDLRRELTRSIDWALAPRPEDRGTLAELREALLEALDAGPSRSRRRLSREGTREQGIREERIREEEVHAGEVREERFREDGVREDPLERPLLDEHHDLGADPDRRLLERLPLRLACAAPAGLGVAAACAWLGPSPPIPAALAGVLTALAILAVPRLAWMLAVVLLIVWQLLDGRSGTALVLLAGLAPVPLLLRRAGPEWSAGLLAPLLGLAGLAGAFPAIAGQVPRWRERAVLGALGYWWLSLAEPLLRRHLWLWSPSRAVGLPPRSAWEGSIGSSASHVLGPTLTLGVLLGAGLWALAAVVLPWLVRGRHAAVDIVLVAIWSGALIATVPLIARDFPAEGISAEPRGAIVGAVLGGALAVIARALRGPV